MTVDWEFFCSLGRIGLSLTTQCKTCLVLHMFPCVVSHFLRLPLEGRRPVMLKNRLAGKHIYRGRSLTVDLELFCTVGRSLHSSGGCRLILVFVRTCMEGEQICFSGPD